MFAADLSVEVYLGRSINTQYGKAIIKFEEPEEFKVEDIFLTDFEDVEEYSLLEEGKQNQVVLYFYLQLFYTILLVTLRFQKKY